MSPLLLRYQALIDFRFFFHSVQLTVQVQLKVNQKSSKPHEIKNDAAQGTGNQRVHQPRIRRRLGENVSSAKLCVKASFVSGNKCTVESSLSLTARHLSRILNPAALELFPIYADKFTGNLIASIKIAQYRKRSALKLNCDPKN